MTDKFKIKTVHKLIVSFVLAIFVFITFRYALPKHRMMMFILMFTLVIDVWLDHWINAHRAQLPQRASKLFLGICYTVVTSFVVMAAAFWILPFTQWTPFLRTYVIGAIIVFVCVKITFAGIFFLQFLCSRIHFLETKSSSKHWFYTGIWVAVFAFAVMLYGTIYGAFDLQVQRVDVKDKSIPKNFDGYKIVQFSDLHIGSQVSERYVKKLVDSINAQNPDLIVFTGDMVNLHTNEVLPFISLLSEIHAKDGVYAIFGNHDYSGYLNWEKPKDSLDNIQQLLNVYESLNWRVLQNEHVYLYQGNDSIVLAGVDNYSSKKSKHRKSLSDTKKALTDIESSDFVVMLSHNPQHFEEELEIYYPQINLTLSGHSHGGQMAVGVGEYQFSPSQLTLHYWRGFHHIGNQYVLVNTGAGFNVFPFRIGMPPSISAITLFAR